MKRHWGIGPHRPDHIRKDAVVGLGTSGLVGLGFTRAREDAEVVISGAASLVGVARRRTASRSEARSCEPGRRFGSPFGSICLSVSLNALQKWDMPPPSLGGLYRASEMLPALEAQHGKVRDALEAARGWFASASAALRKSMQEQALGRADLRKFADRFAARGHPNQMTFELNPVSIFQ